MKNKKLILDLINELFGDTSVPPEQTLEALEEIASEVLMKIDAIESDLCPEES